MKELSLKEPLGLPAPDLLALEACPPAVKPCPSCEAKKKDAQLRLCGLSGLAIYSIIGTESAWGKGRGERGKG